MRELWLPLLLLAALGLAPLIGFASSYETTLMARIMVLAMAAVSLSFLVGGAGLARALDDWSSRAAAICARPITAAATAPPRAPRKSRARPPAISGFAASGVPPPEPRGLSLAA